MVVFCFVLNVTILNCYAQHSQPVREKLNINRDWKFKLGDYPGANQYEYDDTGWSHINLPHSFSIPYFGTGQWYVGYGWYRKNFIVSSAWLKKRIAVEFEGAFRDAEVFANGKPVGHHESGYTGFSYDITDALKAGNNVLSVRLNNLWSARMAPRDGDHNFCGGIYRDVYLVITSAAHITWYGTFVTTPEVSKTSGKVRVQTEVINQGKIKKKLLLKTSVVDSRNKIVDAFASAMEVKSGETVVFDQLGGAIANPRLWHPLHPNLYRTISRLYDGNKLIDQYETTFGFRWIQWTADKGFFINGEHYYFKGVNVHQDHAGWASAVTNEGFERDIKMVKEAGFDFIRGSHYPHDPAFSDACDRLGVMLWSENNFWGSGNYSREGSWYERAGAYPVKPEDQRAFEDNVKNSLTEMIRIHRNHPSVVTWSMGNELFFTEASTSPKVKVFLKELIDLTHRLDPSRKAAIGGVQRGEIDMIGDIAGYNGDGARLFINPGIANVVSEYGSTISDRPGTYFPGWGDLQQTQYDWRSGQVMWCAFDYGTHFGDGQFGHMGMIDYFRLPKRMWYWYRNEYKHIPPPRWPEKGIPAALSLNADKTIVRNTDGTDDVQLVVTVLDKLGKPISNTPDVTLHIESGPGAFPTGRTINFSAASDIAIRDGQAAIEFHSYEGGLSVIKASSPGLQDAEIKITTRGLPVFKPGITPVQADIPYIKFRNAVKDSSNVSTINMVYQKPTKASSEMVDHPAKMANDQNNTTFWMAKPGEKESWWRVDMENLVSVHQVKVTLSGNYDGGFKIQVSADGNDWKDMAEQAKALINGQQQTLNVKNAPIGRFLRVIFKSGNVITAPAIQEIEAYGKGE